MSANGVILIGGFCETIELCQRCGLRLVGIVDANSQVAEDYAIPYLGTDEVFLAKREAYRGIPLVVVPDSPNVRRRIVERYRAEGFTFASVIAPDSDVSPSCGLGEGVVVHSHVVITAQARIGAFVRVNLGAKIMHESVVEDFVTVAPNATILGRVRVGALTYVGASSTTLPGCFLGTKAVVGAGAVVTRDVSDGAVVVGVPAKRMECV